MSVRVPNESTDEPARDPRATGPKKAPMEAICSAAERRRWRRRRRGREDWKIGRRLEDWYTGCGAPEGKGCEEAIIASSLLCALAQAHGHCDRAIARAHACERPIEILQAHEALPETPKMSPGGLIHLEYSACDHSARAAYCRPSKP